MGTPTHIQQPHASTLAQRGIDARGLVWPNTLHFLRGERWPRMCSFWAFPACVERHAVTGLCLRLPPSTSVTTLIPLTPAPVASHSPTPDLHIGCNYLASLCSERTSARARIPHMVDVAHRCVLYLKV